MAAEEARLGAVEADEVVEFAFGRLAAGGADVGEDAGGIADRGDFEIGCRRGL